ncbi:bifunctional aldolase/short-chain dehydrogenase [Candidatus Marinimicrobia bacterium MT.SAG.3]|nr:bifunctional aldolase/short-chain dehydrogenase [Candidatus Marinimicrobia bacterium MT.SAG.3]
MKSLWDVKEGNKFSDNPLAMRVYSSRLLGTESELVLHGGGNTSVKTTETNIFGESEEIIYVKGSGWDLATIEPAGFAPVKLNLLKKMAQLSDLSDSDMVKYQRAAMTEPNAPNPSVEAVLHALIPFKFVDHTHADAVVTITNSPGGEEKIREIYGNEMLIVPYVMPGFILAKKIHEMTKDLNWEECNGMILMSHGVFTFDADAQESYRKMIAVVTKAEEYIESRKANSIAASKTDGENLKTLSEIRREVMSLSNSPLIARLNMDPGAVGFSKLQDVDSIATRGPLTPDHIIRTKQFPVIIGEDPAKEIENFSDVYKEYFSRNNKSDLIPLNSAPNWAVWKGQGTIAFGKNIKESNVISDIVEHTISAIQRAEALGGWKALPEKDLFEIEYWDLEQSKLAKKGNPKEFEGKIAIVTGAANGIGKATTKALLEKGAVVAALDIDPAVKSLFDGEETLGIECDLTDESAVHDSVESVVRKFGGLDLVVSNAGTFPSSENIEEITSESWNKSLNINLTSHQLLLKTTIPYLKNGYEPNVIFVASKNVAAPGPGAASYSVAKAGLTQLARVAALELGSFGIRINVIHPNAVFDTSIWSEEIIKERAEKYKMSVDEYRSDNLLKTEIRSEDVANLICAMAGSAFAKTTGAQIPIDGGNKRVI